MYAQCIFDKQLTECKISYWSQTEFDKAICHGLVAEFRCTQFTFSDWEINKTAGRLQTTINTENINTKNGSQIIPETKWKKHSYTH